MINKVFRVFAVIAAFVAAQTGWAADDVITYDGFSFDIYLNNNYGSADWPTQRGDDVWFSGAVLVNINGKTGEIVVPSHVPYNGQDIPVVGISGNENTFYKHSGIPKVTIPGTVRLCENNCFREMSDLIELVFEDGEEDLWLGYSPGGKDDELTWGSDNLNKVTIGRDLKWYTDEDEPFEDRDNLRTVVFTKGCNHIGIPGIDNTNRSLFNSCPDIETFIFEDSDKPLYVEYYALYTKDARAARHQWKNIYIGRDIQYPGWDKDNETAREDGYSPFYEMGNDNVKVTLGEKVTTLGSFMFFDTPTMTLDCKPKKVTMYVGATGIKDDFINDRNNRLKFDEVEMVSDSYYKREMSRVDANKVTVKSSCSFIGTVFDECNVETLEFEPSDEALSIDTYFATGGQIGSFLCHRSLDTYNVDDSDIYTIKNSMIFDDKCESIGTGIMSLIHYDDGATIRFGKSVKHFGTYWMHDEYYHGYYSVIGYEGLPTVVFEAETIDQLPEIEGEYGGRLLCDDFVNIPVYLNANIDPNKLDREKWNCNNFKVSDQDLPTAITSPYEHNGFIITDSADSHLGGIYTLTGARLQAPQKGLNIINGKKVVIK